MSDKNQCLFVFDSHTFVRSEESLDADVRSTARNDVKLAPDTITLVRALVDIIALIAVVFQERTGVRLSQFHHSIVFIVVEIVLVLARRHRHQYHGKESSNKQYLRVHGIEYVSSREKSWTREYRTAFKHTHLLRITSEVYLSEKLCYMYI